MGKLEHTSAMARPTNRVMTPTNSQPQMITTGPPVSMPNP